MYIEFVGVYNFSKDLSVDVDGRYFHNTSILEEAIFYNNRGVYQKEKDNKCLWWHWSKKSEMRRWILSKKKVQLFLAGVILQWRLLGYCEDVADYSKGLAELDRDEGCPYVDGTIWTDPPRYWVRSHDRKLLTGYTLSMEK